MLTEIILGFIAAFLIIYDIIIMITEGADATISWVMWTVSKKYPIIPFAMGVLMGHLFWVQHGA